jgi:hypothetical protein
MRRWVESVHYACHATIDSIGISPVDVATCGLFAIDDLLPAIGVQLVFGAFEVEPVVSIRTLVLVLETYCMSCGRY